MIIILLIYNLRILTSKNHGDQKILYHALLALDKFHHMPQQKE